MARTLDAIRHYTRIAWWDGSALGLHLSTFSDLLGLTEGERGGSRRPQGGTESEDERA